MGMRYSMLFWTTMIGIVNIYFRFSIVSIISTLFYLSIFILQIS